MHFLWWMPFTAAVAIAGAYATMQVNKNPNSMWFWFLFCPLTVWPIVARMSKNIVFDGYSYDILVAISWMVGFMIFGAAKEFTIVNYGGLALATLGLILLKL